MRSILVGEVRTGRRITQIPVSDASWEMVHRGSGQISVDIPLDAGDFRRLERTFLGGLYPGPGVFPSETTFPEAATPLWRPGDGLRPEFLSAIEPARCFLAVLEDDDVLVMGPIWSWDYTLGEVLKVTASDGPWSLLDRRMVMGAGVTKEDWARWAQPYAGLSLGTIAKRVVELVTTGPAAMLPIVLPADESGTATRTYKGYDLASARSRIEQIMGVIDGPDVRFVPRLTADRMGCEWVMEVGTTANPLVHQASGDWIFDSRAVRGGVGGLNVKVDASGLASRSWVTGAGSQTALLMARDDDETLTDAGFPLLEVKEAHSDVEIQSTLDRWASGNLAASRRPWQTWTATVQARPTDSRGVHAGPQLGMFRPGDFVRVWISADHPLLSMLLPEGYHRARLLSVKGGMGDQVDLTFMPVMGG